MKYILLCLTFLYSINILAQTKTPDVIYGALFTEVQNSTIFKDSKTFVDCIPKRNPKLIVADYLKQKNATDLNLENFISNNFSLQAQPNVTNIIANKKIEDHIKDLWKVLSRAQDKNVEGSSLLPLPYPYIVPGGRFTEVYYWDSYFTMLGLKESGETALIENMINNFAFLINTYGHIPNGNRSYYLSRSQPPFFSLMVQLLASIKGNSVYKKYLVPLQKEYNFWMAGVANLKNGAAFKRVLKLNNGTVLNRYCDDLNIPRQEGYKEDVKTAETAVMEKMKVIRFSSEAAMNTFRANETKKVYKHLRSAAESGWDFGSRWFTNPQAIATIHTTDFAPVDLNCLISNLETVLLANGGRVNKMLAAKRIEAIKNLFWNSEKQFYCDYDFVAQQVSESVHAAGYFPLFLLKYNNAELKTLAPKIVKTTNDFLLKPGGIVSSTNNVGQQWDAPNGWAPQQWVAINALNNINELALATTVASRWVALNKKVYNATGKLTEKYNVIDLSLETGGGEYPNLDGFGWTNGVFLALVKKYGL